MIKYLEEHGVHFQYDTKVTNVVFDITEKKKTAKKIEFICQGKSGAIDLTKDDLLFITNGSCTENSTLGDDEHAPDFKIKEGGCWDLWRNIAAQDPSFGRPDKFCTETEKTNWESSSVTTLDMRIPPYIEKICKRDPFSGKVVTGGIITVKDSSWLMSYTLNRQPHFKEQPDDQLVIWIYGLFTDVPGDFIKKPMRDCTGREITEEWLYHIGVPVEEIHEMALNSTRSVPCMMPYITAFFMPRTKGDRPDVVPEGSENFAFIGQFAETVRDTVFTTEYSVRTGMESVYTLLDIDRGVPEVFNSAYDIRVLLDSTVKMMDGQKPLETMKLPLLHRLIVKKLLKKIKGTLIEEILMRYKIL
jgi:oleate hydratase